MAKASTNVFGMIASAQMGGDALLLARVTYPATGMRIECARIYVEALAGLDDFTASDPNKGPARAAICFLGGAYSSAVGQGCEQAESARRPTIVPITLGYCLANLYC